MRCDGLLVVAVSVAIAATTARAELLPNGVLDDEQTSIVYAPDTGEVAVDAPAGRELAGIFIDSMSGILIAEQVCSVAEELGIRLGGDFVECPDEDPFKPPSFPQFGSTSFGNLAQPGLPVDFLLNDLNVIGSLIDAAGLGPVDLVYMHELFPGDADRNLRCDQLDLVQVLQRGKYLTGQPATWGEGDWDGAPGGYPGNPPPGDGLFDQLDIINVLGDGCPYLTGPYAAIKPGGVEGDEQTSIIYDTRTGEIAVDVPAGTELTSIDIDSAAAIFTGPIRPCARWASNYCGDVDYNIFYATFGSSFGSLSWGNVAQPGLSEDFLLSDLTVVGSLAGGGALRDVDLIYVPEPSSALLALLGIVGLLHWRR